MTSDDSFDPSCWFLAEDDDELVGVCLTWKEGWINGLAVAPAAAGAASARRCCGARSRGSTSAACRASGSRSDAHNPTGAFRLDESVGMRVVKGHRAYVKKL